MWWAAVVSHAIDNAIISLTFGVVATLIMYASARANTTKGYESRRSIVLLQAARHEGANRRHRDAPKNLRSTGIVCVNHDVECWWWSDRLGVSPERLRALVRHVGPMAADIERHLRSTARPKHSHPSSLKATASVRETPEPARSRIISRAVSGRRRQ